MENTCKIWRTTSALNVIVDESQLEAGVNAAAVQKCHCQRTVSAH